MSDDVLAGYRDLCEYVSQWWMAEVDNEPAGVLLLAEAELIFVGVVPKQRGQGVGPALVNAACEKSSELSLVVDVRNTPAVQSLSVDRFRSRCAREVFLKFSIEPTHATSAKSSIVGE